MTRKAKMNHRDDVLIVAAVTEVDAAALAFLDTGELGDDDCCIPEAAFLAGLRTGAYQVSQL